MRRLSILCFLLIHPYSSAEYLFYVKENEVTRSLTEQEHAAVYPTIQRYTFPMNTNPILTFSELSENDVREMYQHEYEFLKKQLSGICEVQYIPTTLYELLSVRFWTKLKLMLPVDHKGTTVYRSPYGFPEAQSWWKNKYDILATVPQRRPVREALMKLNNLWKKDGFIGEAQALTTSFELYKQLNDLDDIQSLHCIINNNIFDYLESQKIDIGQLIEENTLQTVLTDLIDYFKPAERNMMLVFSPIQTEMAMYWGLTDESLISQAMLCEKNAWAKGAFVVYRGTSCWEGRGFKIDSTLTCRRGKIKQNSISLGNSLFAAILGNNCLDKGDMAYHYIENSKLGYALAIDKYDYALGALRDLFQISPLNTVVGLAGQGEFFHTRTKATFSPDDRRLCGVWFFNGAHQFYVPSFLINTKASDQSQIEDQFSHHLVANITILKNKTGISLDEFKCNQLKPADQTLHIDLEPDGETNELEYTPSIEQLKIVNILQNG